MIAVVGGTERGVVTERTFDANGDVASTRVISQDIAIPGSKSVTSISDASRTGTASCGMGEPQPVAVTCPGAGPGCRSGG